MRLIDADAFAKFLREAVKDCNYTELKLNDCCTVADVIDSVIAELDGSGIDKYKNCPTIQPCEDAVSREAVLDAVNNVLAPFIPILWGSPMAIPLEIARAINNLPSVKPCEERIILSELQKKYADNCSGECESCEYYRTDVEEFCGFIKGEPRVRGDDE